MPVARYRGRASNLRYQQRCQRVSAERCDPCRCIDGASRAVALPYMLSLPDGHWPATLEPDRIPSDARIEQVELDRAHPLPDSLVRC
jgi:hypothetical protein